MISNQQTLGKLRELRLHGMAAAYQAALGNRDEQQVHQ
jgi:hypothetical protein